MSNNVKKYTLKHPENTNKTCYEAFWEILENPVLGSKMWFLVQISNYAKIPWNTEHEKHPLDMLWGILRNLWKFSSRLKDTVLGPDVEQCQNTLKHSENTN